MGGKGVSSEACRIVWLDLIRFKRTFTEPVPKQREQSFAKAGIATYHGRARFLSLQAVQVGDDILEGRHVVIATGQEPARLNIPGEGLLTTSDQFLELEELPPRIAFIGGGYISFEFAHIAARAGAQATILHRGERPLELFEPDLVNQLVEKTRQTGIRVHLGTQAEGIERAAGHLVVHATTGKGREAFEADLVVHGAGRVPEY
jgi:glutathione reductase (NADPH)